MLFAGDLELSRAVALETMFDPSEPGVQFLEEGPGSCPAQYNHNVAMWRGELWWQYMQYEGGA